MVLVFDTFLFSEFFMDISGKVDLPQQLQKTFKSQRLACCFSSFYFQKLTNYEKCIPSIFRCLKFQWIIKKTKDLCLAANSPCVKKHKTGNLFCYSILLTVKRQLSIYNVFQRWNSWTTIHQKTRFFCFMLFTVPSTG